MSLDEIIGLWEYESTRHPNFIKQSDDVDYWIYTRIRRILDNILLLVDHNYLDDIEIDLILDSSNKCSLDIINYMNETSDNRILLIADYIINFVDGLKQDLVAEEYYEAVSNITKFEKLFYSYEI